MTPAARFALAWSAAVALAAAEPPVVKISSPMPPPGWALMERALLVENARLMERLAARYVNPINGYLECVEHWGGADGPDDAMENFYNWPLVYVLGGPRKSLDLFHFVWEGHLRQYTALKMFHREFITSFDWEHTGEGLAPFFLLPLADPNHDRTRERMVRFAGFYTGRDPSAGNYDPGLKIIRSILNGSRGPRLEATPEYWGDREDHDYFRRSGDWTRVKGDVPMNLISTSLATNAYILTGDTHYRDWVLEYMGAWRERAAAGGGWVPSIVGLNGQVGEGWDGKWYGGLMGWNWTFGGWSILGRGVRIGFGNAALLGGPGYLDILRTQGRRLLEARTQTPQGPRFRNKYGDQGPYDPVNEIGDSLFEALYSDVYLHSLHPQDLATLREAAQPKPAERRNTPMWRFEHESGRFEGGNEIAWIDYLEGHDPGYPERALRDAFARIRWNYQGIASDRSTPDTRRADSPHTIRTSKEAPLGVIGAATGALVNLTLGGAQPMWSGGLLRAELRYFDPERRRAGLPDAVAALVTKITPEYVKVILVNTSQTESRRVAVQTGGYGEHFCERVLAGEQTVSVGARAFEVELEPGAGGEVTIYRRRFASQPTFRFPW
ncbi:MAG: hypothetical protein FJW34_17835 [Acidobacteria bacterium]|nr:hypothetical protein [Acidobacteriota bacterium]